jgi:hypothetical protein
MKSASKMKPFRINGLDRQDERQRALGRQFLPTSPAGLAGLE